MLKFYYQGYKKNILKKKEEENTLERRVPLGSKMFR